MASYDGNSANTIDATKLIGGDHIDFRYLGSPKAFTLPAGSWLFECWGARAGSQDRTIFGTPRARGGYCRGAYTNTAPKQLYIRVGGAGKTLNASGSTQTLIEGGWNGGGGLQIYQTGTTAVEYSTGGGASDIRFEVDDVYHRVLVAGGAGGSSGGGSAGAGGWCGSRSVDTYDAWNYTGTTGGKNGNGGSLIAGGIVGTHYASFPATNGDFGNGGNGSVAIVGNYYCGGGGGGWFGGGGSSNRSSSNSSQDCWGGGGSCFGWCAEFADVIPLCSTTIRNNWALTEDDYLTNVFSVSSKTNNTVYQWFPELSGGRTAKSIGTFYGGDGIKYPRVDPMVETINPIEGHGFVRITKLPRIVHPKLMMKINGVLKTLLEGSAVVNGGKSITLKTADSELINFMDINDG